MAVQDARQSSHEALSVPHLILVPLEPIIFPNIGGAGPNYIFTDVLRQPCFVVPHATHDQANHAPNENMEVEGFFRGIRTRRNRCCAKYSSRWIAACRSSGCGWKTSR